MLPPMFDNINTRSVTFNLIVVNALMFLVTMLIGEKMYELFALFYPASPLFKPMQVITHLFMHGSFLHIFMNMFALFMFGSVLERIWGPQRFMLFYFTTGIGAMLLHTAVQGWIIHNFTGSWAPDEAMVYQFTEVANMYNTPTVGASGAIFGILIAFGVLFPNTELLFLFIPVPIKAKYFVAIYVVFELYQGIKMSPGDNVAHFAHLGGALFGYLLVKYWNRNTKTFY
jgi:membrane associated rhomboid family serine protease